MVDGVWAGCLGWLVVEVEASVADAEEDVACSGELQVGGDLGAESVTPERDGGVVGGHQVGVMKADHGFTSGSGVIGWRARTTFVVRAV